jgi:Holliday junction resolvasome RuvABC ATP-dependent DNA helicase subunit
MAKAPSPYASAKNALDALKIDELGLDDVDIKYLSTIIDRFHGGPVGLEAIASSIGEEIRIWKTFMNPICS